MLGAARADAASVSAEVLDFDGGLVDFDARGRAFDAREQAFDRRECVFDEGTEVFDTNTGLLLSNIVDSRKRAPLWRENTRFSYDNPITSQFWVVSMASNV